MSLIGILDTALLQPLMLIYDLLYTQILKYLGDPGWSLIVFSVVLNLVLTPIYFQMERAGREYRRAREVVEKEVARLKAHFKGRELYFYIRTVHRHHGFRPISVIFTSADLYLQVLVFLTVYRYISGLESLAGVSFFQIADLSQADGLLFGLNLLPILMTVANVLSAMVYGGGKSKQMQAFGLAGLFLVLLYQSPSGLVLYWTTNNVFSLVRNLAERKITQILPSALTGWLSKVAHQE